MGKYEREKRGSGNMRGKIEDGEICRVGMGKKCIGLWKVSFEEGGEAEGHLLYCTVPLSSSFFSLSSSRGLPKLADGRESVVVAFCKRTDHELGFLSKLRYVDYAVFFINT
jgi:hypothetical protein